MIVIPNVICVAGVFTAGFGIWASVVFNNITAVAALANGLWPMRQVAANEKKRRQALAAMGVGEKAAQKQPPAGTAAVVQSVAGATATTHAAATGQNNGQSGNARAADGQPNTDGARRMNGVVNQQVFFESNGVGG